MARPRTLRELGLAHGTDKAGAHSYADVYERFFAPRRNDPVKLLEIGVGGYEDSTSGGQSLRMWKDYFPRGSIVAVDIYDKRALAEDRIVILQGDQGDREFLERVGAEYGPFDIVIDDGSHRWADVITSFEVLFHHTAPDGIYAIEDLQTSYWYPWGGPNDMTRRTTTMTMLKRLVDGLNYSEFDLPGYVPSEIERGIVSLSFYHNLVFVQKGANDEPSSELPPHPRAGHYWPVESKSARRRRLLRERSRQQDALGRTLAVAVGAYRLPRRAVRGLGRAISGFARR